MEEDFDFEDKDENEEGIDDERHWKSLSIAFAVIFAISSAIIISIFILTPSNNNGNNLEPYTLSEVITKQVIKGNYFNGTWINDYQFIYQSSDKNVLLWDFLTGNTSLLTTKLNTTTTEIIALEISTAQDYLLITSKRDIEQSIDENVACQDVEYQYYVYDLRNGNLVNLENEFITHNDNRLKTKEASKEREAFLKAKAQHNTDAGGSQANKDKQTNQATTTTTTTDSWHSCRVQSAEFTPLRNHLLIVASNDIYWMDLDGRNGSYALIRLTFDGSIEDSIMNGLNDYIYREMLFGRLNSFYWSKDKSHLCYISLNNTLVPLESMTLYPEDTDSVQRNYRYPNINNPIGQASLWVIDMSDMQARQPLQPREVKTPDHIRNAEHYITYVDWIDNQNILVIWILRDQTRSVLGLCSKTDGWVCREHIKLTNYLELKHTTHSVVAGDLNDWNELNSPTAQYFLCGQVPESGEKTYYQLYSLHINSKVMHTYLNNADLGQYYRVSQLLAYNRVSQIVFFLGQSLSKSSSLETFITEQDMRPNVFAFSVEHNTVSCLSCHLDQCHQQRNSDPSALCIDVRRPQWNSVNSSQDELCLFQSALFSPSAHMVSITCLVGIVPKVFIVKFGDLSQKETAEEKKKEEDLVDSIVLFDDNHKLKSQIETKIIPRTESFIITREYNNHIKYLRMKILAPPDFSDEKLMHYAFLFEFHSGQFPFHESIEHHDQRHEYPNTEWAIHMVTQHQFIYAWLDGHLAQDVNYPAGAAESMEEMLDDYSALLEYVQANMTFVNVSQSCLLGTNAAASLVLSMLSWESTQINCGVVFSPITNWNHINTLLAEQYLDIDRFRSKDPNYLTRIQFDYKQLNKRSLLILHGTTNELVPLSQTIQLMKKLSFTAQHDYVKGDTINESDVPLGDTEKGPAYKLSNQQYLVLYINHGSTFDGILEHLYRKIESFLFTIVMLMN